LVRRIFDCTVLALGQGHRYIDSPSAPPFISRQAYHMMSPTRPPDYAARAAWALCLPTKLKIFSYLACIDNSRANLFFKGCAPSDVCAACAAFETCRHILFDYTLAASVWVRLGVAVPAGPFSFWELQRPAAIGDQVWRTGVVVVLWCIWKARNAVVFNNGSPSTGSILQTVGEELTVWRWRFKPADRPALDSLCSFFLSRVPYSTGAPTM
jgi:hypothetical protein